MGYDEEKEEEYLRRKASLIKDVIRQINTGIDRWFERLEEFEEEKRKLKQKGIGSGLDEALHAISRELALELLKEDREVRETIKEHLRWSFKEMRLEMTRQRQPTPTAPDAPSEG